MSEQRKPDFGNVKAGAKSAAPRRAPDFGNVKAGAKSTAPRRKPDFSNVEAGVRSTAPTVAARTYTVKRGDSLSKIAKAVYANANKWKLIYEANRDQIADADLIHPGQVLKIPELPR
jgi:nucleoid-associated protein YgaU